MPRVKTPNYLEQMNNGAWRVTVPVPKELVKVVGRTRLKRSLGTHSRAEAERMKHVVVGEFFAVFDHAKRKLGEAHKDTQVRLATARFKVTPSPAPSADLHALALDLRDEVRSRGLSEVEARDAAQTVAEGIRGQPVADELDEPVYDPLREAKAQEFVAVALGDATPIRASLPSFYSEGKWIPRTKADSDRAVGYLTDWLDAERLPLTVEAVTRRVAGRFVSAMKADEARPLTNKTINKYLACLSSYWKWMERRGLIEDGDNPWRGQSLPKEQPMEDERERPFTDKEITKLLQGKPNQPYIRSLMLIAALTGARIDAVVSLKVKDTDDGCFRFKAQKKETGSRLVPIHRDLVKVVGELVKGKRPDDDLFPECPPVAAGKAQERSMPAVKAFTYYRRSVGVTDVVEGKRRDRVNFHSFRRWFITKLYQADQPQIVIDKVVGHKPQSIAGSVYLGGLDVEQLKACVESVRLPRTLS